MPPTVNAEKSNTDDLAKVRAELVQVKEQLKACTTKTAAFTKEKKEIDAQVKQIDAVTPKPIDASMFDSANFGRTKRRVTYARYKKIRNKVWFGKLIQRCAFGAKTIEEYRTKTVMRIVSEEPKIQEFTLQIATIITDRILGTKAKGGHRSIVKFGQPNAEAKRYADAAALYNDGIRRHDMGLRWFMIMKIIWVANIVLVLYLLVKLNASGTVSNVTDVSTAAADPLYSHALVSEKSVRDILNPLLVRPDISLRRAVAAINNIPRRFFDGVKVDFVRQYNECGPTCALAEGYRWLNNPTLMIQPYVSESKISVYRTLTNYKVSYTAFLNLGRIVTQGLHNYLPDDEIMGNIAGFMERLPANPIYTAVQWTARRGTDMSFRMITIMLARMGVQREIRA